MGRACPVCDRPLPDARRLADHAAFAAMTGDDDHEAWLDEHAPGWDQEGTDELAAVVRDRVPEREFAFEERPVEDEPARQSGRGRTADADAGDPEAQRILQEAIDLTRQMRGEDEAENE